MNQTVRPADKNPAVSILSVALRGVGVPASYVSADLVYRVNKLLERKGGEGDLKDLVKVQNEHRQYWMDYADRLAKENLDLDNETHL